MSAKLRVYFRNIMLFVHFDHGTDVWLTRGHKASLITSRDSVDIGNHVVTFVCGGKPLPPHPTDTSECARIVRFNEVAPDFKMHDAVTGKTLSSDHICRVELRGRGKLVGLPSAHSFGVLLDWTIPVAGRKGQLHTQRLTEVAVYEVEDVPEPVQVVTDPGSDIITVPTSHEGGVHVAEVFVIAGETVDHVVRAEDDGKLRIHEFRELYSFFDEQTQAALEKAESIPTAEDPGVGTTDAIRTAFPFCPDSRVDLRSDR